MTSEVERIDLRTIPEANLKEILSWAVSLAYTCQGERIFVRTDTAVAALVSLEDAKRLEMLDHSPT